MNSVSYNQDPVVQVLGVAQKFPGMADSSHIELHRVGVDSNRNGSVFEQPFHHVRLVGADIYRAANLNLR